MAGVTLRDHLLAPLRSRKRRLKRARQFRYQLRMLDDPAQRIVLRVRDYTLLGPEKLFGLIQATRYVAKHRIEGAIVECGVWRGGAVMASVLALHDLGVSDRTFYLYDTFNGMSAPTERDFSLRDEEHAIDTFEQTRTGPDSADWCRAGLEDVRRNLATLPYDPRRFVLVEGKVEETIPATLPDRIAILRLDTDWYESTRHEMEHLMPRLVPRGVLIVDDYFRWAGNREAVDAYLEREGIAMLLTKVGRSAMGVRP